MKKLMLGVCVVGLDLLYGLNKINTVESDSEKTESLLLFYRKNILGKFP